MGSEKVLVIIPARGGSKGLPRKNLRKLGGVPLIAHTVRHAKGSHLVHRVVVSTDDAEIATVARSEVAEVIMRPHDLATDSSPSEESVMHVLDQLERRDLFFPDIIVLLQCTTPLRESDDIDQAVETLLRENADSVFSACRRHVFLWSLEDEKLHSVSYDAHNREPRQAMPVQFE